MNPPEPGRPRTPGTGWSQASDPRAGDPAGREAGATDAGGTDVAAGGVTAADAVASGGGASGVAASGGGAGQLGAGQFGAGGAGAGEVGAGAGEVGVISVSADPVAGADIIESGAAAPVLSWRRSTMAWTVVVALVVGGAAGYLLGVRHAGAPAASPSMSSSAGPAVPPPHLPALAGTGNRCAMQLGKRLQLGVEVVNGTAAAAVIDRVAADLPLNGLREVDAAWGTCGQLTTVPPRGQRLEAGASGWLTVTFDVLVPCPSALPVGFVVQYERGGQPDGTEVWGFSDLGDVSYSGCPTG